MAEVDPVILQLKADLSRYEAELKRNTRSVEQLLGNQSKNAKALEQQMQRSSGAIANTVRGLAGTLAAAFTGRELVGLIDGYTRLQNELRVAGLEGEALTQVQGRLSTIANANGVAINSLADLYGKAAQTGKELGASQEQLIALTQSTALALRISGTNAQTASGAILGLSQALASGVVRAEEFNQINEGGLRPLLQAAAASERFGGSVAKLRTAVIDGKLSSQEFFRTILAGLPALETKAASATLTLSGAFETLNNKLIEYVGGAASANGATAIIATAIKALADNIDTLIPALATIAIAMGVRTAAGALAASRAMFALRAAMAGAATAGEALAFALNGLKGALPLIAVTALVAGIIYLAQKSQEATKATGAYAVAQREAANASERATELAQKLATAHGKVRVEALAAARAEAENTKQKLAGARASLVLAQAELKKAQAINVANAGVPGGTVPGSNTLLSGQKVAQAQGNVDASRQAIQDNLRALKTVQDAIDAAVAPPIAAVGDPDKKKKKGRGATGPTVEEIQQRFADELTGYTQQTLQARQQTALNAEEAAELELRSLEHARRRTLASIAADKDYSAAQKAELTYQVEALAQRERESVEFRRRAVQERDAQDLADERYQAEQEQLRLQLDLADTQSERRALAFRILDAEDAYLRSKLEAVIASQTATDAARERARIALEAVNGTSAARQAGLDKQYRNALGRYADSAKDADTRVAEAAAQRIADLNETITDAMTDALGIEDPFLSELIKIFLDKNVFGPLAEALSKGGGNDILSAIGTALGAIFKSPGGSVDPYVDGFPGRASGGRVNAGQLYRINEGASPGRVEGFIPQGSGNIIPLGRMNAAAPGGASAGGTVRVIIEEAPGFAARVRTEATGVAVEITRMAAPSIVDAAANETLRRANRPTI